MNPKKNPMERRKRPTRHPGIRIRMCGASRQAMRNKQATKEGYIK